MRQLVRPNVHIVNVHALGGLEMMRAAVEAASEGANEFGIAAPHVLAVTLPSASRPRISTSSAYRAAPVRTPSGLPRWRATRVARA